jgi:predicted kinase
MEVAILIGLQAAGKTTFSQARLASHEHVSKDLLRNARQPTTRQAAQIAAALAAGKPVVVDNTNATLPDRAALIAQARALGARVVGYYFEPDLPGSRARNATRVGRARVPEVALYVTAKKLRPPSFAEGFDEILTVRVADGGGFDVEPWPRP